MWGISAIPEPQTAALSGHIEAEVAIIGGGFTGLSTALHLSSKGVKVALLEANRLGFGGSGRNVGLVNAGMWLPPDDIEKALGRDTAERLIEILGEAPSLVYDLIERYAIECEAVRNGTLHCAVGKSGLREIEARASQWLRRGADVRLLDRDETARRVGGDGFSGALLDMRAGTIQPLSYVRGLAHAALSEGAKLFTSTPVRRVEKDGTRWKLETPAGSVKADFVVVGTNAYSGSPWPALVGEFVTVHYFQCATEPMKPALRRRILANGEGTFCTRTVLTSLRTDAAGRLIFGSLGALAGPDAGVHLRYAKKFLGKMIPELRGVEFEHAWFGKLAMTRNSLPRFHELDERIYCFHGYNGRGIGTGTMFGKLMAERIIDPRASLPMPSVAPDTISLRSLKSGYYRVGSALAHL